MGSEFRKMCPALLLVLALAVVATPEPFILNVLMSVAKLPTTTSASESWHSSIQKLKEKTAAINQHIEITAPAGRLGNFASSVISATADITAGKINLVTKTVDNVAKETVNWMKNVSTSYSNRGVELVLRKFKEFALTNGMDNMTLPDVDTKISGVTVTASGGHFASLTSVHKSDQMNVTLADQSVLIQIPLSLSVLDAGYSKFQAKLFFLSMSGSFKVNVQSNSILVVLRLRAINPCAVNVERVQVESLDGISVEFKQNCRICGSLISSVSSGLANFMKRTLMKQVQEGIENGIQRVLKDDSYICAQFVQTI